MSLPVIGMHGPMGSGKDTAAQFLALRGYSRLAFADEVRREVGDALFKREPPPPEMPPDIREVWRRCSVRQVWAKPTHRDMRIILQWWGTEYRRAQDPDYWLKRAEAAVAVMKPGTPLVVTDVRLPNEVDWVRRRGGEVWAIDSPPRGEEGIPGHASEMPLEGDRVIPNRGTQQEYRAALLAALNGSS